MGNKTANVGSKTFYSLYDLTTGELLRIQTPDGVQAPDPQVAKDYRFESMTYANGDRYVGETVMATASITGVTVSSGMGSTATMCGAATACSSGWTTSSL